jgi:hypothetical protein
MTKKTIKLTLRAFNGECESLIARVRWNNVERLQAKIEKAFEIINRLNKPNDIHIQNMYLNLKVEELKLTHEYELKKHEEKEEQKRIRAEMREEERARKEIEKAQRETEKEEERYRKALEVVEKQLTEAQGEQLDKLNNEIEYLRGQVIKAHEAHERAVSRAQLTKSGHVYVISNIGSFGEQVYKIGMTRRLEPMERVKELGDASVPFRFDVHAMIYSDNAPDLEYKLHQAFVGREVNLVNKRKEFYRVSLSEIEEVVQNNHKALIKFTKVAEAREYRETLAKISLQQRNQEKPQTYAPKAFPEDLF